MKKKKILTFSISFLWLCILAVFWYLYLKYNLDSEKIIFGAKSLLLGYPISGILCFVLIYSVRPMLFLLAGIFDIFAGMVFGPVGGILIAMFATGISLVVSYVAGYVLSGEFIEKKSGKKITRLKHKLRKDPFYTALTIRLILLPYDVMNYLAGSFKIDFWKYFSGTMIGIFPATFVFVSAGSAFHGKNIHSYEQLLENIKYENLWFASGFFATILLVAKLLKKRQKNITL